MKYNIESVIKRLEKAKGEGKVIIDEMELLRIATPRVNCIDRTIKLIGKGIKKSGDELFVSYREAETLTGIPRITFNRWEKEGIVTRTETKKKTLSLGELKGTLSEIMRRGKQDEIIVHKASIEYAEQYVKELRREVREQRKELIKRSEIE
jgi:hypothetical protein